MKLEHVAANVSEPAALAQWLVDNLDMRIVFASNEAPYMHFVADASGSMIELYSRDDVPVPDYATMSPFNLHFAFATADIEADRQRLLNAGATVVDEITDTLAGDRLAFLRTPWQEPIQLVQRRTPLS